MDPSAIPSASLAAFIAIITAPPVAVEPPVRIAGRSRGASV
jgi:hypothetical protein